MCDFVCAFVLLVVWNRLNQGCFRNCKSLKKHREVVRGHSGHSANPFEAKLCLVIRGAKFSKSRQSKEVLYLNAVFKKKFDVLEGSR